MMVQRFTRRRGALFAGIVLFCGSLYALTLGRAAGSLAS